MSNPDQLTFFTPPAASFNPPGAAFTPTGAGAGGGVALGIGSGQIGSGNSNRMLPVAGGFDNDEEPPLLQELGIDPSEIWTKARAFLIPSRPIPPQLLLDADLAGPLFFSTLLGFALLFQGKVHFGYIFGFGLSGCAMMWIVINLMTDSAAGITFERTVSVLGYALLPIIGLAILHIALPLQGVLGFALNFTAILWCTFNATRFIEAMSEGGRAQRYLFAYPIGLLYACFALLTVF